MKLYLRRGQLSFFKAK